MTPREAQTRILEGHGLEPRPQFHKKNLERDRNNFRWEERRRAVRRFSGGAKKKVLGGGGEGGERGKNMEKNEKETKRKKKKKEGGFDSNEPPFGSKGLKRGLNQTPFWLNEVKMKTKTVRVHFGAPSPPLATQGFGFVGEKGGRGGRGSMRYFSAVSPFFWTDSKVKKLTFECFVLFFSVLCFFRYNATV